MNKKGVIIGCFTNKNKILSFLEILKNNFKINLEKVNVYTISSNENEYLVTFKTYDKDRFVKKLFGITIMHVKNGCLFSINAINKLIERNYDFVKETPYNEVEIDWNLYKDKLIILSNGELNIKDLSKIEDKCIFFK